MKILYVATYYVDDYVRQTVVRRALRENSNIELVECVVNKKSILRYLQCVWRFIKIPKKDVDVVIVGFRGHEILPFIRLLTNKPIVFDAFISLYDTLCFDRNKFASKSFIGKFLKWYDAFLCKISTKIFLDTQTHIDYFVDTFRILKENFFRVFVGADEKKFFPRDIGGHDKCTVFYYGTVLPLQGIDVILRAAKLLENRSKVNFIMVGPIKKQFEQLLNKLQLTNVTFIDWVPYDTLSQEINKADICLGGHFSDIPKAHRVIAGKTFQFIAMQKATIVGRSVATNELFTDELDCMMVEMGDVSDLVRAIQILVKNAQLREDIAREGYRTFNDRCSERVISIDLHKVLKRIISTNPPS